LNIGPRGSSRTNVQVLVLVLVLESQVLDNNTAFYQTFLPDGLCRSLLCSDEDQGDTDVPAVHRCVIGCRRVALENRLREQEQQSEDGEENHTRTSRGWFFPELSRWHRRMLMSGIGSRSRSAGAFLRIGRSPWMESGIEGPAAINSRAGRHRSAGRYLRIGRTGESADREVMASGTADDLRLEGDPADVLHLRKVNRDVPQQP